MSTVGSNPTLSATHPDCHGQLPAQSRASRRGRQEAYCAALEMRFGATRRGFESPPLRQPPHFSRCVAPPVPPRGSNDEAGTESGGYAPVPGVGSRAAERGGIQPPALLANGSFVGGSVPRNTLTEPHRPITPRNATAHDAADVGRAISPVVCAGHREPRIDPESGPPSSVALPGAISEGQPPATPKPD
jgi:hypothetical protein